MDRLFNSSVNVEMYTSTIYTDDNIASTRGVVIFPWYPYAFAATIFIVITSLPGNILTLLAYKRFHYLRTSTNMFIVNQSVAEVLLMILGIFFMWANYTRTGLELISFHKYICLLVVIVFSVAFLSSAMNILLISTERLIAVCFSYQYYRWMKESNVKIIIIIFWIFITITSNIPFFGFHDFVPGQLCTLPTVLQPVYMMITFLIPIASSLIITAVFNMIIGIVAFRKNRVLPAPTIPNVLDVNTQENANLAKVKEFKVTKMLLMVVGLFYFCWLPWIIMTVLLIFPIKQWQIYGPPHYIIMIHDITKLILPTNSIFNPFIYAWRNKDFHMAFSQILGINRNE